MPEASPDRVVVVTGAFGVLGAAVARAFGQAGARLGLIDVAQPSVELQREFAGHLLLLVFILGGEYMLLHGGPFLKVISFGSFAMGIVMTFFELLVQFLQAYIFTLLTALYIATSLAEEH